MLLAGFIDAPEIGPTNIAANATTPPIAIPENLSKFLDLSET